MLLYQILVFTIHEKKKKADKITINSKYLLQHGVMNLNYQMDHIRYQIFQDYFEYILKKHSETVDNPSIKINVNKVENRVTFKIKTKYYLELLTAETKKLLGNTESKITKDKNGEYLPHLEVVELLVVDCNIINNSYQRDLRILYTFVLNKPFGKRLSLDSNPQPLSL